MLALHGVKLNAKAAEIVSQALYMYEESAEVNDSFADADRAAILNHAVRDSYDLSEDERLARIAKRGVQA